MQAELGLDFSRCQRWRQGRERYRPAGEVFDHRHATVEIIDSATAKRFVQDHHQRQLPRSQVVRWGVCQAALREGVSGGVSVFSVPMSQGVIPARLGVPPNEGGRIGTAGLAG